MIFLFLAAPLLLGRPLWPPSCLPILAAIDFLADFIALPTAFRVNILTIVFTTMLLMPPIRLVLPRWGRLTLGLAWGISSAVLCLVVRLDLFFAQVDLDGLLVLDHPYSDVKLLPYRAATRRSPPGLLPSARPGVILYLNLLAPHVFLDDLPLGDDVFADADLLFRHRLFLDHDLVLDHRHGYLVGAYLGLGRLAAYRRSLDTYLLASGRHLDALAVGPDALADFDASGHALAGPREQFFFAALDPELVLVLEIASGLAQALLVAVVLAELACFRVVHAH